MFITEPKSFIIELIPEAAAVAFYFTPVSCLTIGHKIAETVRDVYMNLKLLGFFFVVLFLSVSGYTQFQEREDQNLQTFHKGTEIKREDAVSL